MADGKVADADQKLQTLQLEQDHAQNELEAVTKDRDAEKNKAKKFEAEQRKLESSFVLRIVIALEGNAFRHAQKNRQVPPT